MYWTLNQAVLFQTLIKATVSNSCAKHLPLTVPLFQPLIKSYITEGDIGVCRIAVILTIFRALFIQFNPLTAPGAFRQKHTFWTFWRLSAWKWAK